MIVHSPIINRRENAQSDKNKHKYVLCRLNKEKNFDHKSKLHFIVIHYSAIPILIMQKTGMCDLLTTKHIGISEILCIFVQQNG